MIALKGRIIDGTGRDPIENGILEIEGCTIIGVFTEEGYQRQQNHPADTIIEVEDGTILPGFIEQHCHLGASGMPTSFDYFGTNPYEMTVYVLKELDDLLDAGFTGIREAAGVANYLKDVWEKGIIRSPRIFSSGKFVSETGGHADEYQKFPITFAKTGLQTAAIADGIDECRRTARELFRSGADYIKICTSGGLMSAGDDPNKAYYTVEEIRAFVEEAEQKNTYVASHAQGTKGIKNALLGGVKSIEHGILLDDECIDLMLKNDAYLVPTFSIAHVLMQNVDSMPAWTRKKFQNFYEIHYRSVEKAHKAGVKIGLGSDFCYSPEIVPYGKNGMEFERLVVAGLNPMEAIVAGTKTGSELILRADELGTLEKGKIADVVIMKGNPLEDISLLGEPENIAGVLLNGEIVKGSNTLLHKNFNRRNK